MLQPTCIISAACPARFSLERNEQKTAVQRTSQVVNTEQRQSRTDRDADRTEKGQKKTSNLCHLISFFHPRNNKRISRGYYKSLPVSSLGGNEAIKQMTRERRRATAAAAGDGEVGGGASRGTGRSRSSRACRSWPRRPAGSCSRTRRGWSTAPSPESARRS
jgi:hypothetical protein